MVWTPILKSFKYILSLKKIKIKIYGVNRNNKGN